jgi:hypothetical protein
MACTCRAIKNKLGSLSRPERCRHVRKPKAFNKGFDLMLPITLNNADAWDRCTTSIHRDRDQSSLDLSQKIQR